MRVMLWLRRLFSGAQLTQSASISGPSASCWIEITNLGDHLVNIRALDMMGQRASSPDGRFSLVSQDGNRSEGGRGRAGRYVLINDGKVVVDGRMERPQDGKVTDSGVFVLNNWGSAEHIM